MGLTALDIIVILLIGAGLVLGFLRGFVFEMLTLIAWIGAIMALSWFHEPVTAALVEPIGTTAGASVAAFVLVFGIVFLFGKLLSRRIGQRVRKSVVGPVDRLLGGGFGALKGLIIATLLYLAANFVYDMINGRAAERPDWMRDARTYPLLQSSGEAITDLIDAQRGPPAEADESDGSGGDTQ